MHAYRMADVTTRDESLRNYYIRSAALAIKRAEYYYSIGERLAEA